MISPYTWNIEPHIITDTLAQVAALAKKRQHSVTHLAQLLVEKEEAIAKQTDIKKALIVIQEVATNTQTQLKNKIVSLVNMALRAVFEAPPVFAMELVSKRNRTECELSLQEGKYSSSPEEAAGGGVLDVVSFALRVVMWTFTSSENTLILDEPFKYLSADRAEKASAMLAEISRRLNLQIIMVSHQDGINTAATMSYTVRKPANKPSTVTML